MSDSVRPHNRQPIRLGLPWDSPGKNTGVGCHFLLQCMKVKSESEVAQSCLTLGLQPTRLLHPWDFPGKSTGVGCHCLLRSFPPDPRKLGSRNPAFVIPVPGTAQQILEEQIKTISSTVFYKINLFKYSTLGLQYPA